ncbi:hypothetical protein D9M68_990260 [compost metagenome]
MAQIGTEPFVTAHYAFASAILVEHLESRTLFVAEQLVIRRRTGLVHHIGGSHRKSGPKHTLDRIGGNCAQISTDQQKVGRIGRKFAENGIVPRR